MVDFLLELLELFR